MILYHNDHLGTPQKMTASNGAVVWSAKYEAFGKAQVAPESTVVNNLRFPGQYWDEETGLHWNWFRYYDPGVGRYIRKDPLLSNFIYKSKPYFIIPIYIANPLKLYPYIYAYSAPVINSDPRGLDSPGCDRIPNILETRCVRKCCDVHDNCYDANNCTEKSWRKDWCGNPKCKDCNRDVVVCMAKCILTLRGPGQLLGGPPVTWPPWGI